MLIATSLMYSNDTYEIEKQYKALQTWRDAGFDIISCNVLSEIKQLPILFPQVRFVELKRSGKERTGKPFPFIFDLLEALRENIVQENEVCGIINSDIFIKNLSADMVSRYLLENGDTILILHRYDIENENDVEGEYYFSGIDAFFFLSKHLKVFPDRGFMLGRPEWDHWFLYEAMKEGLKVREIKNKIAFHIKHRQRWTPAESNGMTAKNVCKSENNCFDEQYYYETNRLMSDLSNRIIMKDVITDDKKLLIYREGYYIDADREDLLEWETEVYGSRKNSESIGVVYFKDGKAYRICSLHREVERNQNQTFSLGQIFPDERGKGSILRYIDFKDFDFVPDLGRLYIYPAGRASRLLVDCLNTYQIPVLGMVDRDSSLWGTEYRGNKVYDLSVLEDTNFYDHILIATNLYVKEIYESLSAQVGKQKLIIL